MKYLAIIFWSVHILSWSLFCADIATPELKHFKPIAFQILFEDKQLLPYLDHKSAYALLQVNKHFNKHIAAYRTIQINDFNNNLSMQEGETPTVQIQHETGILILIDSNTVIFDASGNYASGYARYNERKNIPMEEDLSASIKENNKYGTCMFAYPSCICKETRENIGTLQQSVVTENRIMSGYLLKPGTHQFNSKKVNGIFSTWGFEKNIADLSEGTTIKVGKKSITCYETRDIQSCTFSNPEKFKYIVKYTFYENADESTKIVK